MMYNKRQTQMRKKICPFLKKKKKIESNKFSVPSRIQRSAAAVVQLNICRLLV